MIKEAIGILMDGKDLDDDMARTSMEEIMDGVATPSQIGSFLTAIRLKGESIDEITAFAEVMREKALKVRSDLAAMDIVGTGGDLAGTFNISTTTAFVVAAGGVRVAKHGNRGVSSKSGAADVLECLGVNIATEAERASEILEEHGICFMFAPSYHSSMKHAAPVRRELGIRTVFNILGPLANPAGAKLQLMGVYHEDLVEPLAKVLSNLGVERGMVICGGDGLDEATLTTTTKYCEIRDGKLTTGILDPRALGLKLCMPEDLVGGNPEENAVITERILSGLERGPKRDVVLLNAALCLYIAGVSDTIREGILIASEIIDSGAAIGKLKALITASKEVRA
jgi:anthranilate phosphoribosyltransferase